jgi:hypothetical protein
MSTCIIRTIKPRRTIWAEHLALMGEKRNAYMILVGKAEGTRPAGIPRIRLEDNIKMDLIEMWWCVIDSIYLAQNRNQWWALLNTAMNLRSPYNLENS